MEIDDVDVASRKAPVVLADDAWIAREKVRFFQDRVYRLQAELGYAVPDEVIRAGNAAMEAIGHLYTVTAEHLQRAVRGGK